MKIPIKPQNPKSYLLLVLLLKLLTRISMEMISEEYCDVDYAAAMTHWYTQVKSDFFENTSRHIDELNAKVRNLESKLEDALTKLDSISGQMEQQQQRTNGGDIVIQRRMDGSVDFHRTWDDYKRGFGNSSGEFFIGLEQLHKLTNTRPYELLVVVEDFENDRRYAKYEEFVIGSEAEKYVLKKLGTYSGTAGDSLNFELGQKFTTRDHDNDVDDDSNCAVKYTGAWWYKACHSTNLNGRYLGGATKVYAQGVVWHPFRGHYYSLKFVEMVLHVK